MRKMFGRIAVLGVRVVMLLHLEGENFAFAAATTKHGRLSDDDD